MAAAAAAEVNHDTDYYEDDMSWNDDDDSAVTDIDTLPMESTHDGNDSELSDSPTIVSVDSKSIITIINGSSFFFMHKKINHTQKISQTQIIFYLKKKTFYMKMRKKIFIPNLLQCNPHQKSISYRLKM